MIQGIQGPQGIQGDPGAGVTAGEIEIDFGNTPVSEAFVDVTGQTGILSNSIAEAWVSGGYTVNNTIEDHRFGALAFSTIIENITAGVGFRIRVFCSIGEVSGKFKLNYRWS